MEARFKISLEEEAKSQFAEELSYPKTSTTPEKYSRYFRSQKELINTLTELIHGPKAR